VTLVSFLRGKVCPTTRMLVKSETFSVSPNTTVLNVVVTMASNSDDIGLPARRRSIRGQDTNTVRIELELYDPYKRRKGEKNDSRTLSRPRPPNVYTCYEAQCNHPGVNLAVVLCCKCKHWASEHKIVASLMNLNIQDAAGEDYWCDTLWKKIHDADSLVSTPAAKFPPSTLEVPPPVPPPIVSVAGKRLSSHDLLRTMRGENEHVKKKQKQVTAENATLRLRNATLERGFKELREQNAIATARIKELEADNVELSSVNQKLQTVADMCNKGTAGEAVAALFRYRNPGRHSSNYLELEADSILTPY
jgi:hypothetical protein